MQQEKPVGYLDAYEDREYLDRCFIMTNCYRRALSPDTNFICGRRGSGKSAIVLKIKEDNKYRYREEVKGHEFYQQLLIELKKDTSDIINKRFLFQSIWKHLIIVSAMNSIVASYKGSDYIPTSLSPIYDYLNKNKYFGRKPLTLWQKIVGAAEKLIRKHRGKSELANIILQYFSNLLDNDLYLDAESSLKKYLSKQNRCLVVVDTIMDGFDRDDVFVKCVEGLLLAVLELTCRKYSEYLEIKCCVPAEIYRYIRLYELSKIRDHLVELSWTPKQLMRVISRRLHYYNVLNQRIQQWEFDSIDWDSYSDVKKNVWDKYFPKYLKNNFGIEEPTPIFILRHTHLTPREVISIVNKIIYEYETHEIEHFTQSIRDGVHESTYNTVNELIISNQFIIPGLEQILLTSFQGKQKLLLLSDVRKCIGASRSFWKEPEDDPVTVDLMIKKLLDIGYFGIVVGEDLKNEHVIKCKFSYLVQEELALSKDTQLAIHPLFYERLNIQRVSNRVVYPIRQTHDRWDDIEWDD